MDSHLLGTLLTGWGAMGYNEGGYTWGIPKGGGG